MAIDSLILTLSGVLTAVSILFLYWWVWIPPVLFFLWLEVSEQYAKTRYLSEMKWVLLEMKVPQDVHRSPKAMEQLFAALHSIGGVPPAKSWLDKFRAWRGRIFKGQVPDWFVFEIVGLGGQIHFYIRVLESHRGVAEAQIYAHYPEAELSQVPDYMAQLPASAPDETFEVNGQEMGLSKEDAYPIRTYIEFEEQGAGKEDVKRIDPLGPVAEALNAMLFGETLGIQYLFRASDDSWIKKGQAVLDKIHEKPEKPKENVFEKGFKLMDAALGRPAVTPEKKEAKTYGQLGPGAQETVKAIERSFTKLAFYAGIRILYAAPRDRYVKERLGQVSAGFKLFASQSLNGFKSEFSPDVKKGFNKEAKTLENKKKLYGRYRQRAFPIKPFILTTEEAATIFHFPDVGLRTPSLPRVQAKKGEPPVNLPVV